VNILGLALLEANVSKYMQEIILFFEALRLDFLENTNFLPPVSLSSFADVSTKQVSKESMNFSEPGSSLFINFELDPQIEEILHIKYQDKQADVSQQDKIRETNRSRLHKQESLNSAENRTFLIEKGFYIDSGERERNFTMMQKNNFSQRRLSLINLVARVFIFSTREYVSLKNPDIACMQFVECLHLVQKSLRYRLEADLSYLFLKSTARKDLKLYEQVFRDLPFGTQFSSSAGSLIKTLLIQHCIYMQFKKSAREYSNDLRQRLDVEYINSHYKLDFCFKESLKKCKDLFEEILQVQKKSKRMLKPKTNSLITRSMILNDAFKLFKEFYDFMFKKQHRVVGSSRYNNS
jgi:hypothetical protein